MRYHCYDDDDDYYEYDIPSLQRTISISWCIMFAAERDPTINKKHKSNNDYDVWRRGWGREIIID